MNEIEKLQGIKNDELAILKLFFQKNDIIPSDTTTNIIVEKKEGHVTALHVSGENIKHIIDQLGDLQKLESLMLFSVRNFNHANFPSSFGKLTSLHTLKMRGVILKEIPNVKLPSLKILTLTNCKFTDFSVLINNCPLLESINLEGCPIVEIPDIIDRWKHLKVIQLKQSKIKAIPDSLYHCANLENIDFRDCNLKTLSPKIGQLVKLKELRVSKNKISEIPKEILHCKELTVLGALENNLSSLPDLFELPNLKELYVNSNKIKFIDDRILAMKLEKLVVKDNPFSGFATPAQLIEIIKDQPYKVFRACENALLSKPDEKEYKNLAIQSIKYILSDFDEHGSANASEYGNKPSSYFSNKLRELEE